MCSSHLFLVPNTLHLHEMLLLTQMLFTLLQQFPRHRMFLSLPESLWTVTGMGARLGVLLQVVLFLQLLSRCRTATGPSKRILFSSRGTRL